MNPDGGVGGESVEWSWQGEEGEGRFGPSLLPRLYSLLPFTLTRVPIGLRDVTQHTPGPCDASPFGPCLWLPEGIRPGRYPRGPPSLPRFTSVQGGDDGGGRCRGSVGLGPPDFYRGSALAAGGATGRPIVSGFRPPVVLPSGGRGV